MRTDAGTYDAACAFDDDLTAPLSGAWSAPAFGEPVSHPQTAVPVTPTWQCATEGSCHLDRFVDIQGYWIDPGFTCGVVSGTTRGSELVCWGNENELRAASHAPQQTLSRVPDDLHPLASGGTQCAPNGTSETCTGIYWPNEDGTISFPSNLGISRLILGGNPLFAIGETAGSPFDVYTTKVTTAGCSTSVATPTKLFEHATATAVGANHACAILDDGSVSCYGRNIHGEVGNGARTTTAGVSHVAGLTNVVQLSASANAACALTSESKIYCWGYLGSDAYDAEPIAWADEYCNTSADFACNSTPILMPFSGTFTKIGVGKEAVCALTANGDLKCLGTNRAGQLGDGTFASRTTPVTALSGVRDFTVGRLHTCAVRGNSEILCWGDDDAAQLGIGGADTYTCKSALGQNYACTPTPTHVQGFER